MHRVDTVLVKGLCSLAWMASAVVSVAVSAALTAQERRSTVIAAHHRG